jgi:methyltransferase (TIGR00027 family)
MKEGRPSETAQIVCLMRALEYEWKKEESLLKDKYAKMFLTGRYDLWLRVLSSFGGQITFPSFQWIFDAAILRSALMDEVIKGNSHQYPVILLGAGFDSRSLRLKDYLKKGIYEIDFPATQILKKSILEEHKLDTSHVTYIEADFDETPIDKIFDGLGLRNAPVILIWEGVTMYLEEQLVYNTIKEVGNYFGKGTILLADYWLQSFPLPQFLQNSIRDIFAVLWNEPIVFGTSEEELQKNISKQTNVQMKIFDYKYLCKHFGVKGTIYSPFFTAKMEY